MTKKAKPGKHNRRWARYVAYVASGKSQAETARHFGVSPQAVGKAIAQARKAVQS